MDAGESFDESVLHFASDDDVPFKPKSKMMPAPTSLPENTNGCFDCNICLDSAQDPVVTLCGHLFCWPCIYKWLQVQSSSDDSGEHPRCPVCKAYVMNSTLVPLYGRGTSSTADSEAKRSRKDLQVPRRPQALGPNISPTSQQRQQPPPYAFQLPREPFHHQQYFPHGMSSYTSMRPSSLGTSMTNFYSPTVGMFGEMVYARFFGSDTTSLITYPYPNSYPHAGSVSPRMRRHEMMVDKSLSRLFYFFLCCIILCLLLF